MLQTQKTSNNELQKIIQEKLDEEKKHNKKPLRGAIRQLYHVTRAIGRKNSSYYSSRLQMRRNMQKVVDEFSIIDNPRISNRGSIDPDFEEQTRPETDPIKALLNTIKLAEDDFGGTEICQSAKALKDMITDLTSPIRTNDDQVYQD